MPERVYMEMYGRSPPVMVSCGTKFTLVLNAAGHVYSSGANLCGQLGQNTRDTVANLLVVNFDKGRHMVMVAAGDSHGMALSVEGDVFCWGGNSYGQLGLADIIPTIYTLMPKQVPRYAMCESIAVHVAAAYMHTIVVTQQGDLWAMRQNVSGQLGLGTRENMRVPTYVGGATDAVFGNSKLVSASCRESFTLALTSEGTVYSFGQGINISLGPLGHILDDSLLLMRIEQHRFHDHKVVSVVSGFNHAAAVTKNSGLYTWGQVDSTCGDAVLAQANLNVGNGDIFNRSLPVLVDRYLPVLMNPMRCAMMQTSFRQTYVSAVFTTC